MSKTNTPRRLGKYVLGPRYKNTEDLGRLFRARNSETGAPALVLEHTARQSFDMPVADWTLRLSSSVSPAHLTLEVESAPEHVDTQDAGDELDCLLEDMSLAVNRALRSPETLRHLRSPRTPDARAEVPVVTPWRHRALGAALAAGVLLLMLRAGNSAPPIEAEFSRPELTEARSDGGWDGDGDVTGAALVGLADFEPILPAGVARPMPKKPFKIQKKPPCDIALEEEHFGGCWVETKKSAPCPDKLYELGSSCYLPAVAAPPPSASISR